MGLHVLLQQQLYLHMDECVGWSVLSTAKYKLVLRAGLYLKVTLHSQITDLHSFVSILTPDSNEKFVFTHSEFAVYDFNSP
jgi:hypothetical protein